MAPVPISVQVVAVHLSVAVFCNLSILTGAHLRPKIGERRGLPWLQKVGTISRSTWASPQ